MHLHEYSNINIMKKIINDPMSFVQDTLSGIYYAHQDEVTFEELHNV